MKTKCPACKCSLEINIAPCGSCMNINHIKLEKALCKDGDHVPLKESLSHIYEEPKPVLHEADKARIEGISGKPLPPIEKLEWKDKSCKECIYRKGHYCYRFPLYENVYLTRVDSYRGACAELKTTYIWKHGDSDVPRG